MPTGSPRESRGCRARVQERAGERLEEIVRGIRSVQRGTVSLMTAKEVQVFRDLVTVVRKGD
jgi:hypothetical protein